MRYTILLRDPRDGHVCSTRCFDSTADGIATDRLALAPRDHDVELWQEGRLVACAAASDRGQPPAGSRSTPQPQPRARLRDRLAHAVRAMFRTPATR